MATRVTNRTDCVTLRRAAFNFPRDSWMEATTDAPAPIISPTPVNSMSKGTQMLIAAIPSLPIPCPANMPLKAVTADMLNIPNNVGMKYFLNSVNTPTVPKSIASLFIVSRFYGYYCHSIPQTKKCRIR